MKAVLVLVFLGVVLEAQNDPVLAAYQAWDRSHRTDGWEARGKSLLEVSAEWVKKWPDSRMAWEQRRDALVVTRSRDGELWKQVDENLIRINPPHTFAALAAYDWVAAGVNVKDGESLAGSEIAWLDSQRHPALAPDAPLNELLERAERSARPFGLLCTLASAQIQLKEFSDARKTIDRLRGWLEGDFKRYFDDDPLETYADYGAKYFILSGQLAEAEARPADAVAFYREVVANPYYRREYNGPVQHTRELWDRLGGTSAGWDVLSAVPALPDGVPKGFRGMPFEPWIAVDYRLPAMRLEDMGGRTWTSADFRGKSTLVYVWASWCAPCWTTLPAIQSAYNATKGRQDVQVVTLSADEDRSKLAAFLKQRGYTFPVLLGKEYAEGLLPADEMMSQMLMVDGEDSIRLVRHFGRARDEALVAELTYKLIRMGSR
jgi:peroxiredoxin